MDPTVSTALSVANDEASADFDPFMIIPDFDYVWPTTSESAHSRALTIPDTPLYFDPSPGSAPTWHSLLDLPAVNYGDSSESIFDVPSKLFLPSDNSPNDVPWVTHFPAHFPTNENWENNVLPLHFPIIDNPVAGFAAPPSAARTGARRAKNPKHLSEADRFEILQSDEWVADFDATWVLCGICANKIKLDDRGSARYYPQNWRKHKDACLKRRRKKM